MYKGKENYETAKHLMAGEECIVTGYGQSMTPILKSGQAVRCVPVTEETILKKNDIVLCKVAGHFYLHKISAIKGGRTFQISNNHGHVNGWIWKEVYIWFGSRKVLRYDGARALFFIAYFFCHNIIE